MERPRCHICLKPNDWLYPLALAGTIKFYGSIKSTIVGKRERAKTALFSGFDQRFYLWQSIKKRIMAVDMEVCE
jgi:hypothetical protein